MASNTMALRTGSHGLPTSAGVKFGSLAVCANEKLGIEAAAVKADAPAKNFLLSIMCSPIYFYGTTLNEKKASIKNAF